MIPVSWAWLLPCFSDDCTLFLLAVFDVSHWHGPPQLNPLPSNKNNENLSYSKTAVRSSNNMKPFEINIMMHS